MKLDVFDIENRKVGDIDVDDSVFAAPVKQHLFWEIVKMQLANRRAGTQSTKTVSMVSGTGKKPYRQKGTGRARQGSLRSAHMVGGGVVHGPHPRSYAYELPKKMVRAGLRSALSLRASEQKLHVVKGWSPAAPKTKDAKVVLGRFGAHSALVIGSRENDTLRLSVQNLPSVKFLPVEGLNLRDILAYEHLFISDSVIEGLVNRLKTLPSRKDKESAHA